MSRQLMIYCVVFALLISFFTLFSTHQENDEQVYLTLAKRITCSNSSCFLFDFKRYNLLGSEVLKNLVDPEYHNGVFFHPPAAVMAFSLAYRIGGEWGMRALPILLYLLIAFTVYKTLILLEASKKTAEMGLALSLCSPLLLFNAQKLWIDLFMGCMLILSFYFMLRFVKRVNWRAIALAGIFFFLAVFTKYWAFVSFVPFVLFMICRLGKKSLLPILLFSLPLLLIVINFFLQIIPISTHPLLKELIHPNMLSGHSPYPFIEYVTQRPLFYYFLGLLLISPGYAYVGFMTRDVYKRIMGERTLLYATLLFLFSFILYSLLLFSIFGLSRGGLQTRYIVFTEPFIILLITLLIEKSTNKNYSLLFLFIIHGILLVIVNAVLLNMSELFPFIELFWARM